MKKRNKNKIIRAQPYGCLTWYLTWKPMADPGYPDRSANLKGAGPNTVADPGLFPEAPALRSGRRGINLLNFPTWYLTRKPIADPGYPDRGVSLKWPDLIQWRIQDFPRGWGANPQVGAPGYEFIKFSPKNCMKLRTIWSLGRRAPGAPPWIRHCNIWQNEDKMRMGLASPPAHLKSANGTTKH